MLWDTAQGLVPRYGTKCRIWLHFTGHRVGSGSMLWDITQDTMHDLILFMEHSGRSGSMLWDTSHDLVSFYGTQHRSGSNGSMI
jgi:hypothetical protein